MDDKRFATREARAENCELLIGMLDGIFATKSLDQWAEVFAEEPDFFWAPVNTIDDLLADPQFHAGGGFVTVPDGGHGTLMLSTPSDFSGTPWAPRAMAPALGEHTREILAEIGRTTSEVEALEEWGVVTQYQAD
jgi:crotonobetainyl-CoA:carnitine CoA-transferase CaiB-like acyl-CoA transferase